MLVATPPDEKTLVHLLTDKLKALTTSVFDYVLIANDVPEGIRLSRSPMPFDFLKLIPWVAVIDFDPKSETDGLYKCLTAYLDNGRAALQPLPLHHDDCERHFTRPSTKMFNKAHVLHSAHQLPWIFANGREGEVERIDDFGTWYGQCKSNIDFALRKTKDRFPYLVAMFLVFGKTSIKEMASLVDSVFSQFKLGQNPKSEKRLVILCDEQSTVDSLLRSCNVRYEVRTHCVAGLSWNVVGDIVTELTGTLPQTGDTKHLLTSSGVIVSVPCKKLNEWKSIEVLDYYESKKPVDPQQAAIVRDNFYRGERVSWDNLKCNHDVKRDIATKVEQCVEERLGARSGRKLANASSIDKVMISISVVTLLHRPGTGGSTLARRILWDLHQKMKCRCAVIEGITEKSLQHLEDLQKFGEKNPHSSDWLPLLLCWNGDDVNQFSDLVFQLSKRGVRGVIVEVKAFSHYDFDENEVLGDHTFLVPSELRDGEVAGLKTIILQLEENQETKHRLLQDVDRDRRLIYFGLSLFGKLYNTQRLTQYVTPRLREVSYIELQLLQFCSFVYIYGHMSIPRACFKDTYLPGSDEDIEHFDMALMSPSCVDLLLEVHETTDKYAYLGWRPAHQLVGEVILQDQDPVRTAIVFLTTMLRGRSYATKYLAEVACELFSKRTYFQRGDEWYDEYDDIATDVCRDGGPSDQRHQQKQPISSRYSAFITEILKSADYGRDTVLALWFTLCTFVRENVYAWQHFSRFLALDIRDTTMEPLMSHYVCELLARNIEKDNYTSLQLIPSDDIRQGYLQDSDCEYPVQDLPIMDGFGVAMRCIQEAHILGPNVSSIYSTEGLIHKTKLECFAANLKEDGRQTSITDVETALDITLSAIEAFKKAQSCQQRYRNWYPLVGEIQVCLVMLEIMKDCPFFEKKYRTRGNTSFQAFARGEAIELPREMNSLSPAHSEFLRSLVQRTLYLLHSVFEHESALHADRSSEEPVQRRWQAAVVAASKLQMKFYSILAFKSDEMYNDKARWENNPKMRELLSDAIMKTNRENPFGSWGGLPPRIKQQLINVLMPVVKERGHKVGRSTIVVLIRACLETDNEPKWSDIVELVHNFCMDFPQSEWAFMFRGMIHFPLPQSQNRVMANPQLAIDSFKKCEEIMEKKAFVYKRARPRYFVGRNSDGGHALVPFNNISSWFGRLEHHRTEGLYLNSPEWWRSYPVWMKLARLQGTRQGGKFLNYKGIRIRMDKDPYPHSEGRDRLWFCVGFTVGGPVAFDPLDEDTFVSLSEAETSGEIPSFEDIVRERRSKATAEVARTGDSTEGHIGATGTQSLRDSPADQGDRQEQRLRKRRDVKLTTTATTQTTRGHKLHADMQNASVTREIATRNLPEKGDVATGDDEKRRADGLPVVTGVASVPTSVTSLVESAKFGKCKTPSATSTVDSLTCHAVTSTAAPMAAARQYREKEQSTGVRETGTGSKYRAARPVGNSQDDASVREETAVSAKALSSRLKKPSNSWQSKCGIVSAGRPRRDLSIAGIGGLSDAEVRRKAQTFGPCKLRRHKKDIAILAFESNKDAEAAYRDLPTAFKDRVISIEWATSKQPA